MRLLVAGSHGQVGQRLGPEAMRPCLHAQQQADQHLASSSLAWTIVRPGSLTDEPGDGRVRVSTDLGPRGR